MAQISNPPIVQPPIGIYRKYLPNITPIASKASGTSTASNNEILNPYKSNEVIDFNPFKSISEKPSDITGKGIETGDTGDTGESDPGTPATFGTNPGTITTGTTTGTTTGKKTTETAEIADTRTNLGVTITTPGKKNDGKNLNVIQFSDLFANLDDNGTLSEALKQHIMKNKFDQQDTVADFLGLGKKDGGSKIGNALRNVFGKKEGGSKVGNAIREVIGGKNTVAPTGRPGTVENKESKPEENTEAAKAERPAATPPAPEPTDEKILGMDKQTAIIAGVVLAVVLIVVLIFVFKPKN